MDLDTALRADGHRVTRPRQVVWEVLGDAEGHLSAAELAERVHDRDPSINGSSIYRTLTLLAELGLVRESRLLDGASTWERAHADAVVHLVCTECGIVRHRDAAAVEAVRTQLDGVDGFAVEAVDVRVTGLCGDCRSGDGQTR